VTNNNKVIGSTNQRIRIISVLTNESNITFTYSKSEKMTDFGTVKIGELGYVTLLDVMPRTPKEGSTRDSEIADAARTSYAKGTKTVNSDKDLIRYLFRHRHMSPFEMCEVKFMMYAPIVPVARQFVRHRTTSWNEASLRYSEAENHFYHPNVDEIKFQSASNRQGSSVPVNQDDATWFVSSMEDLERLSMEVYDQAISKGIARETARIPLNGNIYTKWVWKMNLRNFFHMVGLRLDQHAQDISREYSEAMYSLVKPLFPIACEAFEDYELKSVTLSRLEVDAFKNYQFLLSNEVSTISNLLDCENSSLKTEKILKTLDNLRSLCRFDVGSIACLLETKNGREKAEFQDKMTRIFSNAAK
jgi:thymidylate synthase (FAD)